MSPIIIIGANGFIGRYLTRHFARTGREVVAIARNRKGWSGDGMFLEWNGKNQGPWSLALEGAEAVINLAGRSVNCRYNAKNRREILTSRVDSTAAIGAAIAACRVPPKVWLNAGTATWYRHAEDRPQDDWLGQPGAGFSCEVAQAWEDAFFGAAVPPETRKVGLRIGMALANEPETVFDTLAKLTRRGLGGTAGPGTQRVSWIHMEDLIRAIDFIIADPFIDGTLNLTAPTFPTNRQWMEHFRHAADMPIGLPAAGWILKLGAWAMRTEPELVLKSRWAMPLRIRDAGFTWRFPDAPAAIADLTHRHGLDGFFRPAASRSLGARGWVPDLRNAPANR